jgi:hypothetical protein
MDALHIQQLLIEQVKQRSPDQKLWVDQLAEVLSISKPAAYKRINGSTALSLDDIVRIMDAYQLSFDAVAIPEERNIGFQFPFLTNKINSFLDYVGPLKESVQRLASIPNATVWYATSELPFFYYFFFPDLTYFKFYMYARTVWDIPAYKKMKINLSDFASEHLIKKEVDAIQDAYFSIPGLEFWNENFLQNTLNQIKYFLSSGLFEKPEDAIVLCDRLTDLIKHAAAVAESGKKFKLNQKPSEHNPDITMFYNEIAHTSNIALVSSSPFSAVLSAYDNPNFIQSDDERLVKYTREWFERVKHSSQNISRDSERSRMSFFARVQRKIDLTRDEIEAIIARLS